MDFTASARLPAPPRRVRMAAAERRGGALWLPGLDIVLRREVDRAAGRLAARLA